MKRILPLLLSIIAGLAIMAPHAASAQQPTPNPKGKGGPPQAGKGSQVSKQVVHPTTTGPVHTPPQKTIVHNTGPKPTPPPSGTPKALYHKTVTNNNTGNQTKGTPPVTKGPGYKKPPVNPGNTIVNKNTNIKNTTVVNATSHTTHIKQIKTWGGPKAGSGGGQFTQANNYGGHWVAASSVPSGWNRAQVNIWHGHHYRWFNGGWLIVDNGFWPTGYYQFQTGSSKMYNAQADLANMGYYDGTVDGVAGPETRQAIANYQSDYSLPVDGHLNPPTQVSLGLVPPPPAD